MGWKATGSWRGHYWYDPVPDGLDLTAKFGFGMLLKQSWLFGSLTGEVWDDPPDGMPDRGRIEGRVSADEVVFLKLMPVCHVLWQGRTIPLAEYLSHELGMPLDEPAAHYPIRYTGRYDSTEQELTGTWEIVAGPIQIVSRGQNLAVDFGPGSGRWAARRSPTYSGHRVDSA